MKKSHREQHGIWGSGKEWWKSVVIFKREYHNDRNSSAFKNKLLSFKLGFS